MNDHVYKMLDVVGTSSVSIEDGIQQAIKRCSESISHVEWFQISEVRGHVTDGEVGHYQVVLKVGFRLEE